MEQQNAKQANLSTERLLKMVEYMACQPGELRLTDIASGCGINVSTAHRFLTSLVHSGYAVQGENGLYRLTFAFCRLGESIHRNTDLQSICGPYLRALARKYGASVNLVREYELNALCVQSVSGQLPGGALAENTILPLHGSASGKILLTGWTTRRLEELEVLKRFKAFTPRTITNLRDLRRELSISRSRGYALEEEESEPGIRAVAVPLRDYSGQVMAAIEIRGAALDMPPEYITTLLPELTAAAGKMSEVLGYDSGWDQKPLYRR